MKRHYELLCDLSNGSISTDRNRVFQGFLVFKVTPLFNVECPRNGTR